MVDFGLVQRNDYYTGVVFSAYAEHYGDAILMGGRYDNLLQQFDAPMPAIGFAADVDALAACLAESACSAGARRARARAPGRGGARTAVHPRADGRGQALRKLRV
jgi:ATP phosphoribosyltransferase regulatory subunit HisZ